MAPHLRMTLTAAFSVLSLSAAAEDDSLRACQFFNRLERSGELRQVSDKVLNDYLCRAFMYSTDGEQERNRDKMEVCDHAVKVMLQEWHVRHKERGSLPDAAKYCAGFPSPKKK